MKKYFGVFITLLSAMLLCVLPAKAGSAYSPEAAVDFARNHCAFNHTEYQNNCPNGWICAEFAANCVKAGGIDITPSNLKVVRTLFNTLGNYSTRYEIEISQKATKNGDRYLLASGSNAGKISVGDVIITYCQKHDIYLHAIFVSSIDANGYVHAYAHNGNNFDRISTASRSCKGINYAKEDYSDIRAYSMHFGSSSPAPAPSDSDTYFAAASGTNGGLAINDKAAASPKYSTELATIPEGAVCKVYPGNKSGNWIWVEYNGVSGYAYSKYLTTVTCTQANGVETNHPHRRYTAYSNGYVEYYDSSIEAYEYTTIFPTCTEEGYDIKKCPLCDYSEKIRYVAATGHINTELRNSSSATCADDGYTGDTYCKDCNTLLSYGSIIPKTGHTWNTGVITLSPTTSSTGIKTYTCINCGATKEETIEKLAEPSKPSTPSDKDNDGNNKDNGNNNDKNNGYEFGDIVEISSVNGVFEILKNKCVKFLKPLKSTKSFTIPDTVTIDGTVYKVTVITSNAFKSNKTLKTVTIGTNVKTIGKKAFYGCKNLKTLVVKTTKLTSKSVGASAFTGSYAKMTVKVPAKKYNAYKKLLRSKGVNKKASYIGKKSL